MKTTKLTGGTAHPLPKDLCAALADSEQTVSNWESLTPLARNEWICWVVSVKQDKTRHSHIKRAVKEIGEGKRRPCCWIGCIHRDDKAMSPSQKFVLSKRK